MHRHSDVWNASRRVLIVTVAIALLACLALSVRSAYPAHRAWLPAGAAVALLVLWGPRTLVGVAAGSLIAAWWWTGAALGAVMFAVEQVVVAGAAALLLAWPVKIDTRFQKLGDMGRFIVIGAGGYALAAVMVLAVVPQGLLHVRADLASASRHSHSATPDSARDAAHHGATSPASSPTPAEAHSHHAPAAAEGKKAHAHAAPHAASPRFEWAISDMLGVLLIAPALLFLLRRHEDQTADAKGALVALMLLLAATFSIYSGWLENTFGLRHTTLLILPPAVWLALRYPVRYTLLGNLAVVFIADIGTSLGHGPFSDHTSGLPLLHLVFAGTTLLMAASQRERAVATAEVHRLATRDSLTDLPNRNLLALRLETALGAAQRYQQHVGVLYIDLDHFKRINDSLGHAVGDQLLIAATERIVSVLRTDSMLARVGGDEFVAVTERVHDPEDISRAAARVIAALEHPFETGSHVLSVSCSVGVASYPEDGASGGELIKHADIAMYQAKSSGRNQFRFFSPAMNEQVRQRLEVENGLRAALQNRSLVLHYQPIVDARTGRLQAVEALMRWPRPDGSLVLPGEFIHVAEECGLIESMGSWAIQEAARQVRQWRDCGLVSVPVCVNLSARQLRNAQSLSDLVRNALQEQQLDGADLVLEITESMLLHLGSDVENALRQLARRGVGLSLDDFGTGYSSLGYLARLPIDTLKIDRSFVRDMADRPESRRLVKAMIELAHGLGMKVTAEGVETQQQRLDLVEMGADSLQGNDISPAKAAHEFASRHLMRLAAA